MGNKKVYEPSAFQESILARPLYGRGGQCVVWGLFRNCPWGQNDRHTWLKTFSIPVILLSGGNKFK